VSKSGGSSEYKELMSEFNSLMKEVSSTEVPLPEPLSDPVEEARAKGLSQEGQQSQQDLMQKAMATQGHLLMEHAQMKHQQSHQHEQHHQFQQQVDVQNHSQGKYNVYSGQRDTLSLASDTSQSEYPKNVRPSGMRHAAHSSNSTDSYTRSDDDFQEVEDYKDYPHHDEEALWDSLDEEDMSSARRVGGKSRRYASGSDGSSHTASVDAHAMSNQSNQSTMRQYGSLEQKSHTEGIDEVYRQSQEAAYSATTSEVATSMNTHHHQGNSHSPKRSKNSSHNKSSPVTSSFYDWAANTPKTSSSRTHGASQQHHTSQHPPASPQREIDITQQELRQSIERQQQEQQFEESTQRRTRFPYYETVAAIESGSPHSYHGSPDFEKMRNQISSNMSQSQDVSMKVHSNERSHNDRYRSVSDEVIGNTEDDDDDENFEDSIYMTGTAGTMTDNNNNKSSTVVDVLVDDVANTEVARLEHVNNSLLLALQQEKHERSLLEQKLLLIQDNVTEAHTQNDLVVESHKIEVLRLKGHIRRLSQENGFEDTLQGFEEDMSRVVKERASLKKRCTVLEEKLFQLGNGAGEDDDHDGEQMEDVERTTVDKENTSDANNHNNSSKRSSRGASAHTISSASQSLSMVWTTDGISTANGSDATVSAKEFRILKHKYKRSEKAKEEIYAAYEELKRQERKFMLSSKHSNENSKRFKALYAENEQIAEQLHSAITNLDIKTQEVELLKHEAVALQEAERNIRHERSGIIHDLAVARQRLRENEAELKDQRYRNRFISKHGYMSSSDSSGGRVGPGGHHHQQTPQQREELIRKNNQEYFDLLSTSRSEFQHLVPLPNVEGGTNVEAVTGVAGSSDAMYLRNEEVETLSIKLEQALLDLRDAITINNPSLLPLVHTLSDELREERALAHQQKVALVMKLSERQSKKPLQVPSQSVDFDNGSIVSAVSASGASSKKHGHSQYTAGGKRSNMSVSFAGESVTSRLATSARTPIAGNNSGSDGPKRRSAVRSSTPSTKKPPHPQQQFSDVNHPEDLSFTHGDRTCNCNMSQYPHQHHPSNHDSIIFADGASSLSLMGQSKASTSGVGGKPKMAFFRRVE